MSSLMPSLSRCSLMLAFVSVAAFGCGDVTNPAADGGDGGGGNGDGGGGGDATPGPDAMVDPCVGNVDYEDFWSCALNVACEVFSGCLGDGLDVDDCLAAGSQLQLFDNASVTVSEALFTEAIAAGTMTYNGTNAGACFAQIQALDCWELFDSNSPFDSCGIFTGLLGPGAMCFHEEECAGIAPQCVQTQACGGGQDVCCAGQCQPRVPVGGNCSTAQCAPGAFCRNNVCQAGEMGDACDGSYQCDEDHYCNGNGMCAPDLVTGNVCTDDSQCSLPQACLGEDMPQSVAGNCGDSYEIGDSCDQGGCVSFASLWCDQPNPNALGTCRAVPGLGESCAVSQSCGYFLECSTANQTCVEFGALGASCGGVNGGCNLFLFCDSDINGNPTGMCVAPGGVGAPCQYSEHCQTGICTNLECADYPGCFP